MMKYVKSAKEAVSGIQSNETVFIQSAAATPQELVTALGERWEELSNVNIYSVHTEGIAAYIEGERYKSFNVNTFFVGKNIRAAVRDKKASYIPMFLSEIPDYFKKITIDHALIQVSPPDAHGYCSLGVSVDVSLTAMREAKHVIAQVNPQMPRTHGEGLIHVSEIDMLLEVDHPIYQMQAKPISDIELEIGKHVASVIENGACLQMGIGAIPDATLLALKGHKDLGVHTEMFSDGIIDLVEAGVINGKNKKLHPHRIVTGFCIGSQRLYDFIDDNPVFSFRNTAFVNNTRFISKNPKTTAINSALEVDLFGQVCADSIGTYQYSGVGGQMDFIRGASKSKDGRPIIALPSRTKRGEAKIVPVLKPGASVVTTRAHVHYVATEFGIVDLYGKNLDQRAQALIDIAHPDDRLQLGKEAEKILRMS